VADAGTPAHLALTCTTLAPLAVMIAYLPSPTLLALALDTVVGAEAGAPTYLAQALRGGARLLYYQKWNLYAYDPYAVMLAYLRPTTLLALAFDTLVVADAGVPAYLACTGCP
jgi:hypothetical protein